MKNFKYFLFFFLAASVAVSCSSDDNDNTPKADHALVGTWEMSGSEDGISLGIEVTFMANGTGIMTTSATFNGITETDSENFTWSASGNTLTMFDEDSTYTIVGNILTVNNEDGGLVLTRKN